MSKHTPGPWEIREAIKAEHEFDIRPMRRGDAESSLPQVFVGYRPIATVKHDKRLDKDQAIANAHLIAAAPELLAALKVAEESVGDMRSLQIVRAAIAKAVGSA